RRRRHWILWRPGTRSGFLGQQDHQRERGGGTQYGELADRSHSILQSAESYQLLGGSVIARFSAYAEFGQAARCIDLQLNFSPPAVLRRIGRPITDDILVFQLDGDLLADVLESVAVESIAARHFNEVVDGSFGADRENLDVLLPNEVSKI